MKIYFKNYWPILKAYEKEVKPCGLCYFPFIDLGIGSACDGKINIYIGLIGLEIRIILG